MNHNRKKPSAADQSFMDYLLQGVRAKRDAAIRSKSPQEVTNRIAAPNPQPEQSGNQKGEHQ